MIRTHDSVLGMLGALRFVFLDMRLRPAARRSSAASNVW